MSISFSIIIPVYNKEGSVERCINSVLSQGNYDVEVILINDGSTDSSVDICRRFEKQDSRVLLIEQENKGVSAARNAGLSKARGEYILFCDADDMLSDGALFTLVHSIEKHHSDLLVFGIETETIDYDKGIVLTKKAIKRETNQFTEDTIKDNLEKIWLRNNMLSSCGKAFRKALIDEKEVAFNEELIVLEDFDFVLQFLDVTQSLSELQENIYRICDIMHRDSYLHRSRADYTEDVLYVYEEMNRHLEKWGIEDSGVFWNSIKSSFRAALNSLWSMGTRSFKEKTQKHHRLSETYRKAAFRRYTSDTKQVYSKVEYFLRYNGLITPLLILLRCRNVI